MLECERNPWDIYIMLQISMNAVPTPVSMGRVPTSSMATSVLVPPDGQEQTVTRVSAHAP